MKIPWRWFAGDERGGSLLEMALLAPFLLLIVVGGIDVGGYAHYSIAIANAARAGAEYGTTSPTVAASPSLMIAAAQQDGPQTAPTPTVTATTLCVCFSGASSTCLSTDCSSAGDHELKYVQVTVSGTYTGLFNYPGIPHTFTVTKTATVQYPQF